MPKNQEVDDVNEQEKQENEMEKLATNGKAGIFQEEELRTYAARRIRSQ